MRQKDDIVKKLQKDIDVLQKKIDHPRITNLKVYATKTLVRGGMVLNRVLPVVLAGMIVSSSFGSLTKRKNIEVPISTETMITSTGIEKIKSSFDFEYDKDSVQYTTGWKQNEFGLYERVETTFFCENLEEQNMDNILSLTLEELQKKFVISNVETIQKSVLTDEDFIYKEDMTLVVICGKNWDKIKLKKESFVISCFKRLGYVLIYVGMYLLICFVRDVFIKPSIAVRLKNFDRKLVPILKDYEINRLKQVIELKKENLEFILNKELQKDEPKIKKKKKEIE